MNKEAFIRLCGATVYHVSAATNAANITACGLMSAAAIVARANIAPDRIALRTSRYKVGNDTVLNHQKPLLMGRGKDADFLEEHSLHSWAMQLDRRIYFAPQAKLDALSGSFDLPTITMKLDTGALFDAFADHLYLSPINSGNADRKPVMRGDWIYVPASATDQEFRNNRRKRGLVKSPDSVKEISLTCSIPPDILKTLLA